MTRDEVVAALKARKVSEAAFQAARACLPVVSQRAPTPDEVRASTQLAQAADAERLAEALDAAGRRAFSCSFEGGEYEEHKQHIYAAFLQSLTETTTRETERP